MPLHSCMREVRPKTNFHMFMPFDSRLAFDPAWEESAVNEIFAKKMLHIVFARKGMRDLEGISILGCTLSFTQDRRLTLYIP